jgi:hypothetical protein
MNSKLCKKIRKHVRDTFPYMATTPVYHIFAFDGSRRLAPVCQRAFVQNIKKNYQKAQKVPTFTK